MASMIYWEFLARLMSEIRCQPKYLESFLESRYLSDEHMSHLLQTDVESVMMCAEICAEASNAMFKKKVEEAVELGATNLAECKLKEEPDGDIAQVT